MSPVSDNRTWPWWDTLPRLHPPCVVVDLDKHVDDFLKRLPLTGLVKSLTLEEAIRRWLADDEVISHSQITGRSWCMDNSEDVDELVRFLERAVRGVNAVLEGGIPSATGSEAVQEVEVS